MELIYYFIEFYDFIKEVGVDSNISSIEYNNIDLAIKQARIEYELLCYADRKNITILIKEYNKENDFIENCLDVRNI